MPLLLLLGEGTSPLRGPQIERLILFGRLISYRGGVRTSGERRFAFPAVPAKTENSRIGVGFRGAQPNLRTVVNGMSIG